MKNKLIPIVLAAAAAALVIPFTGSRESRAQAAPAAPAAENWTGAKWEYRVRRIDDRRGSPDRETGSRKSASETTLDELGAQGWELVSVRSDGSNTPIFYFKRPVP